MADKINIPLLILDFLVLLPVSIIRLCIIYMYGSKYNVPNFKVLDVMMHSDKPNFNSKTVSTESQSIQHAVKEMVDSDDITEVKKKKKKIKRSSSKKSSNKDIDDVKSFRTLSNL